MRKATFRPHEPSHMTNQSNTKIAMRSMPKPGTCPPIITLSPPLLTSIPLLYTANHLKESKNQETLPTKERNLEHQSKLSSTSLSTLPCTPSHLLASTQTRISPSLTALKNRKSLILSWAFKSEVKSEPQLLPNTREH